MYFYLDPDNLTGKIIHCRNEKGPLYPQISLEEAFLLVATGEWMKCPGDICSDTWPSVSI